MAARVKKSWPVELKKLIKCCIWSPNTPKFSRRASRAGLLHFTIVFAGFGPQIPQKFPGALRAPYFVCISFVFPIKYTQKFPARFARRILFVFPLYFQSKYLQKPPWPPPGRGPGAGLWSLAYGRPEAHGRPLAPDPRQAGGPETHPASGESIK